MRFLLAAIPFCIGGLAAAQTPVTIGDSITRRLQPRATDTISVALRDGDLATLIISRPPRFIVDVQKPNGSLLRAFITASDEGGSDPIPFVAEGMGNYSLVIANSGDTAARYTVVFKERLSLDEITKPVTPSIDLQSPTIARAYRELTARNFNSADFWKTVAVKGTPMVEPLDSVYDLVTFLWRAEGDVRNVYIATSFDVPNGPKEIFQRLGSTDIWYLTVPLPRGSRFIYQLEPNRPASSEIPRVTRQMDPLNRDIKWQCPAGASKYRCFSVAQLPEAEPQPWITRRPDVPTGKIETQKIHSALQNVDRDLTIYLPAGYKSTGTPYSLVILFDGDQYLNAQWNGVNTWDNLIAAKRITPFVVVMVENLPGRRVFDLVANKTFGDFMAKELVPWIRARYNVTRDAGRTVVGGASAGGFGASYLGLVHPQIFGNVLSMSGAIWWSPEHNGGLCAGVCPAPGGKPAFTNKDATTEPNWIAQLALKSPPSRTKFFLSAGTFEFDAEGTGGNILEETRHLRDILRAKNYDVTYKQFVGGHDGLSWRGMLADGLERLLGAAH